MTAVLSDMLSARSGASPFGRTPRGDVAEYERIKAALNTEAQTNWDSEAWHREQAAILAGVLDYQFTFNNMTSTYFLTRNVPEFEKVYVKERRGLKVFYTSRGGYIEESQLKTETFELPRDTLGFHVSEHDDNVRAGFAETVETVAALGYERLDAEVNRRIFTLLQEAVPSSSPYYVNAAGTGLTAPVLDAALRAVRDAIKPNGLGPVPVTILGRSAAVDAISTMFATGYFPEANEEIRTQGRLGLYRGAQIQQVINYTDENGVAYIPEDEVWVFGGTVGLFAFYGGVQVRQWLENTVDYRHYRARRDIGGLVHHSEQSRRIKIA